MYRFLLCYYVVFSCSVFGFLQPSSPCRRDDNKCLASLIQVVYTESLKDSSENDPLFQTKIDATIPTLRFTLTDTTTKGFRACQVKDASMSSDRKSLQVALFCPRFEMFGHYDANGTIESLPLYGNGGYTLDARNYYVNLAIKLETTVKNGKKYTKIDDFDVDAELKGKMVFKLENLFNGNKDLSAAVHKFIEENPEFVAFLLQKPVFIANIKRIVFVLNKHIENVAVDGLVA